MTESDRRYTDQEVALVLSRATELEERKALVPAGSRGLTLRELQEIAKEVGLSPEVVAEAARGIQTRPPQSVLGEPLSHRVVRAVPRRLGEAEMQRLMGLVEDQVEQTGTVTEALGTVRWTSVGRGHKLDSITQVAITATDQETQIQVVQRYPDAIRALLHFLPGAWGAGIGLGVVGGAAFPVAASAAIVVGAGALGIGVGRAAWQMIARRSAAKVQQVAQTLADEAARPV